MSHRTHLACTVATALACVIGSASATTALTIHIDKDAIKPTPVQSAAIRHAASDDIREFNHPQKDDWIIARADLNDDGIADLLVQYTYDSSFCGSSGCSGVIVMGTAHGYASKPLDSLPNFYGEIDVLATKHHGMRDLRFDDASHVFKWDGREYR